MNTMLMIINYSNINFISITTATSAIAAGSMPRQNIAIKFNYLLANAINEQINWSRDNIDKMSAPRMA